MLILNPSNSGFCVMRLLTDLLVAAIVFLLAPSVASAVMPEQVAIPYPEGNLRALLYRPQGVEPFPAVIGLHGCGGMIGSTGAPTSRYLDWGQRLANAGFVVLFPDSYGSRGLGSQCSVRGRGVRVDRERIADADAARRWLQSQSWVTAERISLLGWSNGGIAALWAVRPRPLAKDGGPDFRSAIALYPGCRRLAETAWNARVPTLILIGGADDWTSPAACEQMVAGARGRSAAISLVVYPGAFHDFDHPNRPVQMRTGYAFSVDGSGKVHTGTNPAARADAINRVQEWLSR
jgi:dienelactone hydrolase